MNGVIAAKRCCFAHIYMNSQQKIKFMKNDNRNQEQRRRFIKHAMLLTTIPVLPAVASASDMLETKKNTGYQKSPLPPELVSEFVRVAHGDLKRVKEMLEKEPMLVNATWDWGGGDFETALGGASHVGNEEIALYLLQNGAREDIFHAAMAGKKEVVKSFVTANHAIVNVLGPHTLPLLYHVAISGNTGIADIVKPHLNKASADCNRSLHAAIRSERIEMTEWLLRNGADDPNTKDFKGNTPIQAATAKGNNQLVELLKKYGGK